MSNRLRGILISVLLLAVVVGLYYLPPVHARLGWRVDNLRAQIIYFFNPPEQAVFQPTEWAQIGAIVSATLRALTPSATATPVPPTRGPTGTPTLTPTPPPAAVDLKGVQNENQHNPWNYCGPANFSMALTFWDWKGNRDVIGKALKPSDKDKNVMPYEFQDYITENIPTLGSALRLGGDIDLLKRLIAGGFPVLAEKGYYERDYTGKIGWMGHYQFVTGYDDNEGILIVQDTYNDGPNFHIPYDKFTEGWRSFDYLFVVVYPNERGSEVMALLGPWADQTWAARHALNMAQAESHDLNGIDQFFAWFNTGTSHVSMQEYTDAAIAYDYAFSLYAHLNNDDSTRPYRIMWYQTSAYRAYYYSERYLDVINLATTTLEDTISEPVLEESLYWRGQAKYMIGDTQGAINDFRAALKIHPGFTPAIQGLQDLGAQP